MKKLPAILYVLILIPGAFSSCNKKSESCIPQSYNVIWDAPSIDALESMPLSGSKGAGANVWVQDSSIWIYLAHNGAYDEQGRLLKLGCIRITPSGLVPGGAGFSQELDLPSGTINIRQNDFRVSLWFAGETLIIGSSSGKKHSLTVSFGTWRDKAREGIRQDVWNGRGNFAPDSFKADGNGFVWFHQNAGFSSNVVEMARSQGIPEKSVYDVTTKRIFGGAMAVDGGISKPVESLIHWQFWDGKAWTGTTSAGKAHQIAVRLGAAIGAEPEKWLEEAQSMLVTETIKTAKCKELNQWREFWNRSHIIVNPDAGPQDAGWLTGRNYQLFRYMLACNRGGELPLLFNGGIFTVDNIPGRITGNNNNELQISEGAPSTPDFRRWIYCHFMSQNQRWLGWPTLASGDAELLSPSLRFYRDRSFVAAARAETIGAQGVVYTEPLDIWGLCCVAPRPDGLCGAEHLTYHFSMMLEHAWMALCAYQVLGIPIINDLPWIEGTISFYDSFYRKETVKRTGKELDNDGKLVLYPSCGLEYAGGATNPLEVVCALRRITDGLLILPDISEESRINLNRIRSTLPEIPTGQRMGKESLLPARSLEREYNKWEPIEMYAVWPYRVAGVTKPETLPLARDTWETVPADRARLCKQDYSWMANVVNMASLAWPDSAKMRVIYKMANNTAPQARFPAFFGPGHDWLPDHNWGGSGMVGLQEMLMAADPYGDGRIFLLTGWPKEWDADFKLHAPQQTVIEASVRNGKVVSLKVNPESREKDIVIDPRFSNPAL